MRAGTPAFPSTVTKGFVVHPMHERGAVGVGLRASIRPPLPAAFAMPQERTERIYCADLCLASGEPMLGTAARVDVWLLLEYRAVWRRKAVEDNELAENTQQWLHRTVAAFAARGQVARPQFIRRPELDSAETTLLVAWNGKLFRFSCAGYDAIADLDIANANLEDANWEEVAEPHYFVCTNGQRDLCCARYGLPTYARLREAVGERVWQTTHVGGHRFAPNVLTLPQGTLYGRVFADDVPTFVAAIEAGALARDYLRGRSAYPAPAQVAEAALEDALELQCVNDGEVTFETRAGARTVRVRQAQTPYQVIASCGKTETEAVFPYACSSTDAALKLS